MRRLVVMCVLLFSVPVLAGAAETKSGAPASDKPRFEASQQVTQQATVLSINKSKREVKLRTQDGDTVSIECGPEVKNFAQIKVKDVVTASYTEKLTVEVEGPGEPEVAAGAAMTTAKPGEKPKATVSEKVQYKATITAIDKEAKTVSLKGTDGREATIAPRNPANLDKVKVGDVVVFTYTQAVAVSVTKAGTSSAAK